jgi:hypothetical protein
MLDDAMRYLAAGLSVIPIDPRTKRPFFRLLPQVCDLPREKPVRTRGIWKPFQERPAGPEWLEYWFTRPFPVNIGIVCGKVSGGLLVLDFDTDAERVYPLWQARWPNAAKCPVVKTGKGYHAYLRCPRLAGNQNLAVAGSGEILVQTRGEGGYVVAPPSVHPSGKRYELIHGTFTHIPTYL